VAQHHGQLAGQRGHRHVAQRHRPVRVPLRDPFDDQERLRRGPGRLGRTPGRQRISHGAPRRRSANVVDVDAERVRQVADLLAGSVVLDDHSSVR
jgi:hypothetical protein